MTENLSQDEIDRLLSSVGDPDIPVNVTPANLVEKKKRYYNIQSAIARYDFTLRNGTFDDIKNARRYLRWEAHQMWLINHGFTTRLDFINYLRGIINRKKEINNYVR